MTLPHATPVESEPLTLPLDAGTTSAVFYRSASGRPEAVVVLGHGAGAGQTHPFMVRVGRGLAERGCDVLTFNFPYMERRRRAPDPAPQLEACFRAALDRARDATAGTGALVIAGGKSMGGRIASHVAATDAGGRLDGLIFLGYPLHPPGRPTELRAAHLGRIQSPMLFVQGSRDPFGTPKELQPILAALGSRAALYVVAGGGHSFEASGRARARGDEVLEAVLDEGIRWIRTLAGIE